MSSSSTTSIPPSSTQILPLPREIRDLIYLHLLDTSQHDLSSLVRVSKDTYLEAIPFLYRRVNLNVYNADKIRYGLPITKTTPSDMIKAHVKGRWFQEEIHDDRDEGRKGKRVTGKGKNPVITYMHLDPERRKVKLLSNVRTLDVEDEEGLLAICSIVCHYQSKNEGKKKKKKAKEVQNENKETINFDPPAVQRIFDKLEILVIRSAVVNTINNVLFEIEPHRRRRQSWRSCVPPRIAYHHEAVFQNLFQAIHPHHLRAESPAWVKIKSAESQKSCIEDSLTFVDQLVEQWNLQSITLFNVVGRELPKLKPFHSVRAINIVFAKEEWIMYPWYHYAIDRWFHPSVKHVMVPSDYPSRSQVVIIDEKISNHSSSIYCQRFPTTKMMEL